MSCCDLLPLATAREHALPIQNEGDLTGDELQVVSAQSLHDERAYSSDEELESTRSPRTQQIDECLLEREGVFDSLVDRPHPLLELERLAHRVVQAREPRVVPKEVGRIQQVRVVQVQSLPQTVQMPKTHSDVVAAYGGRAACLKSGRDASYSVCEALEFVLVERERRRACDAS